MRMIWIALGLVAGLLLGAAPASAQNTTGLVVSVCGSPASPFVAGRPGPFTVDTTGTLCDAGGGGGGSAVPFTPNGNFGTLTATAASSASTAMPGGATVALQNTSTVDVSCVLSSGAATATTNKIVVRGGATVFVAVGSNVNAACINQTGVASNVVVMAGGAGLGTNFGGGGSGGGGGAVTMAIGAVASGAYSAGSIASGALAAGAFAAGAGVDGWDLTQGAKADAACSTATGTCSVVSLLKYLNNIAGTAVPLNVNGTATGQTGVTPGVAQTGTIVAANVDLTSKGGVAFGAMANYGTSPGAVKVDGVNAFVTNTIAANVTQVLGSTISATNGSFTNLLVGNAAVAVGTGAQGSTSPRVTVATDQATNAGAALVKGGVGVVNGGSTYAHVAASQTAQVLGSTGAIGDYLSHCVIYPSTTAAGSVTVFDNANAPTTNVVEFATGTLSNLAPIALPVGAVSTAGAWKVTTGANETVVCYGKFT